MTPYIEPDVYVTVWNMARYSVCSALAERIPFFYVGIVVWSQPVVVIVLYTKKLYARTRRKEDITPRQYPGDSY